MRYLADSECLVYSQRKAGADRGFVTERSWASLVTLLSESRIVHQTRSQVSHYHNRPHEKRREGILTALPKTTAHSPDC